MHGEAPKPPTKRLLLACGLSGGATITIWTMTAVGQFVFGGVPNVRLAAYSAAGLIGIAVTGWLSTRYLLQKQRRASWWEGFAAGDEPLAQVIPLREMQSHSEEGELRPFRARRPS